jgi:hypothetical protein
MYKAYIKREDRLLEQKYILITEEELNILIDGGKVLKQDNLGEVKDFYSSDLEMIITNQ